MSFIFVILRSEIASENVDCHLPVVTDEPEISDIERQRSVLLKLEIPACLLLILRSETLSEDADCELPIANDEPEMSNADLQRFVLLQHFMLLLFSMNRTASDELSHASPELLWSLVAINTNLFSAGKPERFALTFFLLKTFIPVFIGQS